MGLLARSVQDKERAVDALVETIRKRLTEQLQSRPELSASVSSDPAGLVLLDEEVGQVALRTAAAHMREHEDLTDLEGERLAETAVAHGLDSAAKRLTEAPALFSFDRDSLQQLCAAPMHCHLMLIRAALERAEYRGAAMRILVRAKLSLSTPAEVIIATLIGTEAHYYDIFVCLARMVDTEVLLAHLTRGHFGRTYFDFDRILYAAFVIWQSRPTQQAKRQLVLQLRRLSRFSPLPLRARALLGMLTSQIDVPEPRQVYERYQRAPEDPLAKALCEDMASVWNMALTDLLKRLPRHAPDPLVDSAPLRAAPRVGRNELCPCGSGRKFKKCCGDDAEVTLVRPSHADALRELSGRIEARAIPTMERADVARLDLSRMREDAVRATLRFLIFAFDWPRARQARQELTRRCGRFAADALWRNAVYLAIDSREYDLATELLGEIEDPAGAQDMKRALELHAAKEESGVVLLEEMARDALSGGRFSPSDVARSVMFTLPALGVLLARGAFPAPAEHPASRINHFLQEVEDARDELDLPPDDPARDMFRTLGAVHDDDERVDPEREQLTQTVTTLQAELDETTRRLKQFEKQVAEARKMATAELSPVPAITNDTRADAELRARRARDRIDELQEMIREGNAERAELRRQIAEATHQAAGGSEHPAGSTPQEDHDDDSCLDDLPIVPEGRDVLVPTFGSVPTAALKTVPKRIASAAVQLVGRLAAQDVAAWRNVKQAKGIPRQLLTTRVGIHHRLLFRVVDDRLEVVDLVAREGLLLTMRRLAAA